MSIFKDIIDTAIKAPIVVTKEAIEVVTNLPNTLDNAMQEVGKAIDGGDNE